MRKKQYEQMKEKIEKIINGLDDFLTIRKDDIYYETLTSEDFDNKKEYMINNRWQKTSTLYQCYDRPSFAKIGIYEDYEKKVNNFLSKLNYNDTLIAYGVASYNIFMFTLRFSYILENNYIIDVKITPSHDYINITERAV